MKPKKKIAFVSTGGTIAMLKDPDKGGEVPALTAADLLKAVPGIMDIADIEAFDFGNVPSPHMTPLRMLELSRIVEEFLRREDIDGVVLTHGTDTLEETAYFLDLWVDSDKPVCVTGAMRGSSDASSDGAGNIMAALRAAACDALHGCGTVAVLNNEIHTAKLVCKMERAALQAFASPGWGPLGRISPEGITVHWMPPKRRILRVEPPLPTVPLLKDYTGIDPGLLELLLEKDPQGLVLEGFGVGNVSPVLVPGIKRAVSRGIPVVITSRVPQGPLLGTYAYEGGGGQLRALGAILTGELSSQKARIKLMLALRFTNDPERLEAMFRSD